MLTGELLTKMVFTPGMGLNVRLVVRQFAPRPTPALFRQEIAIAPGASRHGGICFRSAFKLIWAGKTARLPENRNRPSAGCLGLLRAEPWARARY